MNNEIAKVRTYFINKEWVLAKELLLTIHLSHKENTTILCKLGDCCMKLHEYDLAKQCYIKCINYDNYYFETQNPKYYLKLAHVYQIYYDPYCISKNDAEQLYESQLLYQQVLSFINDNNNNNNNNNKNTKNSNVSNKLIQKCYFNYAQLLTKLKQYKLAQNYYEKLISFNKNKNNTHHSIHYYYAKLLYISNGQKHIICYHFEQAINLKPNIRKYYYKYSHILLSLGENNRSNEILSRVHEIESNKNIIKSKQKRQRHKGVYIGSAHNAEKRAILTSRKAIANRIQHDPTLDAAYTCRRHSKIEESVDSEIIEDGSHDKILSRNVC